MTSTLKMCHIKVWSGQRKHTGLALKGNVVKNFWQFGKYNGLHLTKDGDSKYYNIFYVMEHHEVIKISVWQRQQ